MSDPQIGDAASEDQSKPSHRPEDGGPHEGEAPGAEPAQAGQTAADRPTEPIGRDRRHATRPIPPIPHAPAPPAGVAPGSQAASAPGADQQPGQPQAGQGSYGQGSYDQNAQYGQDTQYSQSPYAQGPYGQGASNQPGSSQPYSREPYGQQPFAEPAYGQPAYGQPAYGQPAYGQSAYSQPVYGQPQQSPYSFPSQPYYPPAEPRGLSIASMVCGIASLVGFGFFLLPQIAAVILGHMALSREPAGRGFAIAGLAMGYFCLLITVVVIAFFVIGISSLSSYHSGY
ncbi:DUF4190 domain-containing protein [Sinomonas albida]|uniref:DUF4190 domain-containing protein n=1 Tax=Sinomonas albida TaxID=369942 RepID=UPI001B3C7AAF|nr:DUF4190 domain-containing protein [Sinomonas albida]